VGGCGLRHGDLVGEHPVDAGQVDTELAQGADEVKTSDRGQVITAMVGGATVCGRQNAGIGVNLIVRLWSSAGQATPGQIRISA
jgi:hypothetical protein